MVTFNKRYSNGDGTVLWNPERCIHSGHCARSLPVVFRPRQTPWITLEGTATDDIVRVVKGCPSGALQWEEGRLEQ
ncbi:MAG: (4Fe-4S)-binding protein [Bacteroidetes bacterium]|nr:(4Fe-4S)-binding protein [Bacteroidota bacterium]